MPESVTATASDVPRELAADERKAALARSVAQHVRKGWSVQSQTDYQAVLVKGARVSHGLHLFLSLITLGLWFVVWAIIWFVNREQHCVIDVDPYGHVNVQR